MQFSNTNITISNYNSPFPENDINRSCSISSKFQDPNSNNFMFNFPNSPHIHLEYEDAYNEFLEFLDQHKPIENQNPPVPTTEITTVDEYQPPPLTTAAMAVGRKRFGKKDRHSKINTARGPRDRRMRLSLEVARKFFDLQDLLGYDKASRTVDWLLKNAKRAIRELKRSDGTGGGSCSFNMDGAPAHSGSVSVSSDGCEVVSSNHSTTTTAGGAAVVEPHPPPPPTKPKRSKKIRAARATVAKDSRRRARERARERTSQKRRLVINEIQPKIYSKSLTESHGSCSRAPMQPNTESHDLNSDQTRPNPLVYSATWNSSAMMLDNYQDNAGLFSHQIADEFDQYCGKPWEAYSSSFNNLSG